MIIFYLLFYICFSLLLLLDLNDSIYMVCVPWYLVHLRDNQ